MFARFLAAQEPTHLDQAQRLLGIPFKRARPRPIAYLEYDEIAAILASVDRSTRAGRRDYALMVAMFNTGPGSRRSSTCARTICNSPSRIKCV